MNLILALLCALITFVVVGGIHTADIDVNKVRHYNNYNVATAPIIATCITVHLIT